jgi:hypothetical protein
MNGPFPWSKADPGGRPDHYPPGSATTRLGGWNRVGCRDRPPIGLEPLDPRGLEALDHEVDAERQLPHELRGRREVLQRGVRLDDAEQCGGPASEEHGTCDEPQQGHAPRHQAGPVHQPAKDQPVPDADNEARPEQERPVMDRDQRPAGRHERARISAGSSREVLSQGHDRKEADDADGDEGAFNEPGGDIAEREPFVLPLEDGEQRDGGADVGDDEQDLQERAQATPVSAPAPMT